MINKIWRAAKWFEELQNFLPNDLLSFQELQKQCPGEWWCHLRGGFMETSKPGGMKTTSFHADVELSFIPCIISSRTSTWISPFNAGFSIFWSLEALERDFSRSSFLKKNGRYLVFSFLRTKLFDWKTGTPGNVVSDIPLLLRTLIAFITCDASGINRKAIPSTLSWMTSLSATGTTL